MNRRNCFDCYLCRLYQIKMMRIPKQISFLFLMVVILCTTAMYSCRKDITVDENP